MKLASYWQWLQIKSIIYNLKELIYKNFFLKKSEKHLIWKRDTVKRNETYFILPKIYNQKCAYGSAH